jgi:hypothetical protein
MSVTTEGAELSEPFINLIDHLHDVGPMLPHGFESVLEVAQLHNGLGHVMAVFFELGLVRAAVEGRLPRGIGVERLREAPADWSEQFEALGLNPQ